MKEKKTAVITFRTEEWLKNDLQEVAKQNNWSQAQVVEQLCKNFVTNPEPHKITIRATDLIELAKEFEEEKCGGAEIIIDFRWDEETQLYYKELIAYGIECGGNGYITMNTVAKELTEEEIQDIP